MCTRQLATRAAAFAAAIVLATGLSACSDTPPVLRTARPIDGVAVAAPAAPVAVAAPVAAAPAAEQPAPAPAAVLDTLEFRGFEMGFEPAKVTVAKPGRYAVRLVNDGALPHDITFDDGTRIVANPGATAEGEVTIPEGGMGFICAIAGHKDAGMVGQVLVEGQAAPAADHDGHSGAPAATSVEADPNAPAPVTFDPTAPELLAGTVHDIVLETIEKEMVVAPGFVQKVWTFGGTVPGPVIRVKVGDTVRIHLKNPAGSELPHSVDFHSSMVAHNDEMTDIMPGEDKVYEWKANYAGVWMYHCGTAPALHHIANGMYGMVIVEPAAGLPPVDKEFALVQSEWYLGPQGEVSSLAKAAEAAPSPDFVFFNGVANQYKDAPIKVETGERVRVYVLNAGPSVDSAFHIVGTIFDTVIKEGVKLERGNEGNWGSQAVDLAPSQGAIVEFEFAEDGLYPIVTHAFNFVGRGALGLFQAGDGDPKN
ncbi:MAG TPA: multicopper oxidase domain-containing protein [Chloroflexaceae bacterium]|nr:multicopper oxidase domain-containing protein [Chloroflexaceae bacterium]